MTQQRREEKKYMKIIDVHDILSCRNNSRGLTEVMITSTWGSRTFENTSDEVVEFDFSQESMDLIMREVNKFSSLVDTYIFNSALVGIINAMSLEVWKDRTRFILDVTWGDDSDPNFYIDIRTLEGKFMIFEAYRSLNEEFELKCKSVRKRVLDYIATNIPYDNDMLGI